MISAIANLLLSYKYSTRYDAVGKHDPDGLYEQISKGVVQGSKGGLEATFVMDANKYLNKTNTGVCLVGDVSGPLAPYIANYHLHGDLLNGHAVVVMGQTENDSWRIFKTYWDIVVTWDRNCDEGTMELNFDSVNTICYVDHPYQTEGYVLCKNGGIVQNVV